VFQKKQFNTRNLSLCTGCDVKHTLTHWEFFPPHRHHCQLSDQYNEKQESLQWSGKIYPKLFTEHLIFWILRSLLKHTTYSPAWARWEQGGVICDGSRSWSLLQWLELWEPLNWSPESEYESAVINCPAPPESKEREREREREREKLMHVL